MEDALRRYFAELLFFTILPIVIIVVLVLLYFIRTCLFRADSKRCRGQTILGMLLAVYVLLPPIATTIFRGIPCDDDFGVDGESYLESDYGVSCHSKQFNFITAYVYLSIAVYPVGVNVLEYFLLRSYRADIAEGNDRAEHLRFLYEAFKPSCYYWEVVDSVRRVMLTGFLVFFSLSSRVFVAWLLAACCSQGFQI